jgi:chromosomal replication initiation ATPase DnaA
MNLWEQILERLHAHVPDEDFRRWFGATSYASDSGDQLTVWVPTESIRRHITVHYEQMIDHEMTAVGRHGTTVRFVVTGADDDEE